MTKRSFRREGFDLFKDLQRLIELLHAVKNEGLFFQEGKTFRIRDKHLVQFLQGLSEISHFLESPGALQDEVRLGIEIIGLLIAFQRLGRRMLFKKEIA